MLEVARLRSWRDFLQHPPEMKGDLRGQPSQARLLGITPRLHVMVFAEVTQLHVEFGHLSPQEPTPAYVRFYMSAPLLLC